MTASATVLAQLRNRRRAERELTVAAFGDPACPAAGIQVASLSLPPLPHSRAEVEGLARLFPGRTTTWLGEDATEERAKTVGTTVSVVHFAAHGMTDERRPLSSALVLAIPKQAGAENGLLQAWEVFEQVRLDADLVTLSACETALGREVAGEGILGLTRAFQYAGARSVLASLWNVADASTAELMLGFYSNLRSRMPKDEALRQAQLAAIHGEGETAHPFFWAAFELVGDWR